MIVPPTVAECVRARGIEEILHFTTDAGLLGILETGKVLSRDRVAVEKRLEYIFQANAATRKDPRWTDYVSLSITRVNPFFFDFSRRQHATDDLWWSILALDPAILSHEGVLFTTTNNIYWSGVERGQSVDGLEALFKPEVQRYSSRPSARRTETTPDNWTTCEEAEVLYPGLVSTVYLRRIYFSEARHVHIARAWMATLGVTGVDLLLAPERFDR